MGWLKTLCCCWFKQPHRVQGRAGPLEHYAPRLEPLEMRELLSAATDWLPPWVQSHLYMAVTDSRGGAPGLIVSDDMVKTITDFVSQAVAGYQPQLCGDSSAIDPRTIWLGDLTGDGLCDLVVADTAKNRVLVALGQPDGGFGAFQQFATGLAPIGISVADVTGNGLLDVLVANEGSNTVSILLGQKSGNDWSLTKGQDVRVGDGPVNVLVHDVLGEPALFVCDSLSNDVRELRRGNNGTFDDAQPIIYLVGQAPEAAFIGHFDDGPDQDLVTVNFQSRDLTYFSGPSLTAAPGPGRSIPVDHQVVAALMSVLMPDGKNNLALADEGQGITFVVGTPAGPVVGPTVSVPNVSKPTDLVQGSNPNTFYVIGDGQTVVAQMDWPASEAETAQATPAAAPPGRAEPDLDAPGARTRDPEVSLFPLSASGIEIVATATIPDTLNSVTLLATLTKGFEEPRPEREIGPEELDRFYSQPLADFNDSDDALFRFASGQRELLERTRSAGESYQHADEMPGQGAPNSTPLPARAPEGPAPPWIGATAPREPGTTAANSTTDNPAAASVLRPRHSDPHQNQVGLCPEPLAWSSLADNTARTRFAPLDKLAFGFMLPWEDHWHTREASLLLATALAAYTCRHRRPDDESGLAGRPGRWREV
jgi:hypothetical protein